MTQKSRYFPIASTAVLVVALGAGLVAHLAYQRASGVAAWFPPELRYVPANAALVAYVDVRRVMNSKLRELMPAIESGSRQWRQTLSDAAGIDLEKEVDYVVAYVEPSDTSADKPDAPRAMMLVQGTFERARIEQFVRDKGSLVAQGRTVGFVRPDLLAIGAATLVRRALDTSGSAKGLTTNGELMGLIRDASGSTAWIVGYFDAVSRSMKLPSSVSGQVPPVRLVSAKADVNGGVNASITAETSDAAAAEQFREMVRGFTALARLQGASNSQFASALKSLELSGTDRIVQVSLAISPETLRVFASRAREMKPAPNP